MRESVPCCGTEFLRFGDIVHVNGYPQHGCQRDEVRADVAVADGAMVGSPGIHDRIDVLERSRCRSDSVQTRWSARWDSSFHQRVAHCPGKLHCKAFRNLQDGSKPLDEIDPRHGDRHVSPGHKGRGKAAAAEIFIDGRAETGGLETFVPLRRMISRMASGPVCRRATAGRCRRDRSLRS